MRWHQVKQSNNKLRVNYAFFLIASANSTTMLTLGEMEEIVNRALAKEFDKDIPNLRELPLME